MKEKIKVDIIEIFLELRLYQQCVYNIVYT